WGGAERLAVKQGPGERSAARNEASLPWREQRNYPYWERCRVPRRWNQTPLRVVLLGRRNLLPFVERHRDMNGWKWRMGQFFWAAMACMAVCLAGASTAAAYPVPHSLPLNELADQADLICKAEVIASKPVADA